MLIRDARPEDAEVICGIYNQHVRHTIVTFEDVDVSVEDMRHRIEGVSRDYPWLVIEEDKMVCAYAYATEWRKRVAYKQTVETAIYVRERCQGQGYGRKLYQALIERLGTSEGGFHVALGAIALPNPASIALHESLGFKKVAEFAEVGRKFDRWIDVGFWQLSL